LKIIFIAEQIRNTTFTRNLNIFVTVIINEKAHM